MTGPTDTLVLPGVSGSVWHHARLPSILSKGIKCSPSSRQSRNSTGASMLPAGSCAITCKPISMRLVA